MCCTGSRTRGNQKREDSCGTGKSKCWKVAEEELIRCPGRGTEGGLPGKALRRILVLEPDLEAGCRGADADMQHRGHLWPQEPKRSPLPAAA